MFLRQIGSTLPRGVVSSARLRMNDLLVRACVSAPSRTATVELSVAAADEADGISVYQLSLHGVGVEEYLRKRDARNRDHAAVVQQVVDPATPNDLKMGLRCSYIYKYRKTLFSCPNCWLLPALCICSKVKRLKSSVKLVVHVHHEEWGRSSNTGSVAALAVSGSRVLLRGLKEHDVEMQQLLGDPTITTAVLWPGEGALLPCELKELAVANTAGRMAVVALDGTWNNAQKMKLSYPASTLYVRIPPEAAMRKGQDRSLFAPLRKYTGDAKSNGRVCTLEAIAALLHQLEGDEEQLEGMLHNLKAKVDAVRIQGGKLPVYGLLDKTHFDLRTKEGAISKSAALAMAL